MVRVLIQYTDLLLFIVLILLYLLCLDFFLPFLRILMPEPIAATVTKIISQSVEESIEETTENEVNEPFVTLFRHVFPFQCVVF